MQIKLRNDEYTPAEDTFFLEDHIVNEKGKFALDIGCGSCYLTKTLEKSFDFVIGTDINFKVISNPTYKAENIVCCNGADAIALKFDLVVCNLPYLDTDEILDVATDGGPGGVEIPKKIIFSATECIKSGGKFLFLTSSLSNYEELIEFTRGLGYSVDIISKKKLFFEELIIICAIKL